MQVIKGGNKEEKILIFYPKDLNINLGKEFKILGFRVSKKPYFFSVHLHSLLWFDSIRVRVYKDVRWKFSPFQQQGWWSSETSRTGSSLLARNHRFGRNYWSRKGLRSDLRVIFDARCIWVGKFISRLCYGEERKRWEFAANKYNLTSFKQISERFEISCKLLKKKMKENQESKDVYFGLYEVWSGKWKGGLRIHSVIKFNLI